MTWSLIEVESWCTLSLASAISATSPTVQRFACVLVVYIVKEFLLLVADTRKRQVLRADIVNLVNTVAR